MPDLLRGRDPRGMIQLHSGRPFWPLDPRAEDFTSEDIAHGLAWKYRFSGHAQFGGITVAQHSIMVSELCPPKDRLWGLLHDAAEAFLPDIPRPLKRLPEYAPLVEAERRIMAVVCDKYGLPTEMPASVQKADDILLATEARDFMSPLCCDEKTWGLRELPLPYKPWKDPPGFACIRFLSRLDDLLKAR